MKKLTTNRLILIFGLFLKINSGLAQFSDDFSDFELQNNPNWKGNIEQYTVNGLGQMQLNNSVAGTSYIVTAVELPTLDSTEWNFSLRHNFASSGSNFSRIYLAANTEFISSTSVNGYYLKIGESGNGDVFTLYKQTGNSHVLLARGITTLAGAFFVDVKVKRSNEGLWEYYVKSITQVDFGNQENAVLDSTFNHSSNFGFVNVYTVSNAKNFYFDNITITSPPDNSAPKIVSGEIISPSEIMLKFNERLSESSVTIIGNYALNSNLANRAILTTSSSVVITFTNTFSGYNSLSINGIGDINNNNVSNLIYDFVYTISSPIVTVPAQNLAWRSLVINEIMADINPVPNGLPNIEFLEIYNPKNETIGLKNLKIIDGTTVRIINQNISIAGLGYVVFVNNDANKALLLASISGIHVYSLSGLGLTDGGQYLAIQNADGSLIDSLSYQTSWYRDALKDNGGYSLELINPDLTFSGFSNWIASKDSSGGTVGKVNSVFMMDLNSPTLTGNNLSITSKNFRQIVFNEMMADVNPVPHALPPIEYIELYNNSNETINLYGDTLIDGVIKRPFNSSVTIAGNGFLILVGSANAIQSLLNIDGSLNIYSLTGLSLSDGGQTIVYKNKDNIIDSLSYQTSWYRDALKDDGGYSLELINPDLTFSGFSNWIASKDSSGGTVGKVNSVFMMDLNSPTLTGNNLSITSKNFRQIVFNEMMADVNPVPPALPPIEYIELYNNSNETINLYGDTLIDGVIKRPFNSSVTIAGNGFLILVASENDRQALLNMDGSLNIYSLTGLSLSDGGQYLALKNAGGNLIDQIDYDVSWYRDALKDNGGYSLELINPNSPCSGAFNWKASTHLDGGSVGKLNSVYNNISLNPNINNSHIINLNSIKIAFDQPIDSNLTNVNLQINQSGYLLISITKNKNLDTLTFGFNQNFQLGKLYTLTINGLKNCSGSPLTENIIKLGKGRLPKRAEIIINEILADEEPQQKLPLAEFIEIYNSTTDLIDISGITIRDLTTTANGKLPENATIEANSYAILVSSSQLSKFQNFDNVLGVNGFPSLNSTNETITLYSASNEILSQVKYTDKWYRDEEKKEGGWSLERINNSNRCGGRTDWIASKDSNGGTPGRENSYSVNEINISIATIASFHLLNASMIGIYFSNDIDSSRLGKVYLEGFESSFARLGKQNLDSVIISLNKPLPEGQIFEVKISDFYTCYDQKIDFYSQNIGIGKIAKAEEVIINEIFADENPKVGMPESEFIELYNNADYLIDIEGIITDGSSNGKIPKGAVILPKGYVILCPTSQVANFAPFGITYGVSAFPSLNADSDHLQLFNKKGNIISKVKYSNTWYGDEEKKEGGWSLERVDPSNPCGTANNWSGSNDPMGATPGKINSIFANNPDTESPKLIQTFAPAPDTIQLYFNETLDSLSSTLAIYNINNFTINGLIYLGNQLKLSISPYLIPNSPFEISISNIKDCVGNYINTESKGSFYLAEQADSSDIILNEILFNPRIGGNDFVEIYNKSNKYINLKNYALGLLKEDSTTDEYEITSENFLFKPQHFVTLTNNIQNIKNNYPKAADSTFIELKTIPSYSDDAGTVYMRMKNQKITDLFSYKNDYHHKLLNDENGVSLERVNYFFTTNTPENWASASQNSGFATPGYTNSQNQNFEVLDKNISIQPKIFTPDEDGIDDFATLFFNFEGLNNMANVTIFDIEGRIVKKLIRNQSVGKNGFYQWDGTTDTGEKARIGNYMLYIEIFNLQGEVKSFRENVVLGARF